MILPVDTDPRIWAYKYGVDIKEEKCRKCGELIIINIPAISKEFVGFQAKPCVCGNRMAVMKIRDPNFMDGHE